MNETYNCPFGVEFIAVFRKLDEDEKGEDALLIKLKITSPIYLHRLNCFNSIIMLLGSFMVVFFEK